STNSRSAEFCVEREAMALPPPPPALGAVCRACSSFCVRLIPFSSSVTSVRMFSRLNWAALSMYLSSVSKPRSSGYLAFTTSTMKLTMVDFLSLDLVM
ncbi:MAG: hypothetical protein ACK56I_34540, partial [bacterium]